jgi:replicative DNA helicase
MAGILDRPLPQNLDAERCVLGAILLNNAALHRVVAYVDVPDFFRDDHRTIFAAMRRMDEEGLPIELVTLKDFLEKLDQLEKVGGAAYLSSLIDRIPDIANVEHYAQIVLEKSKLRALARAGAELTRRALEPDANASELSAEQEERLSGLSAPRVRVQALAEVMDRAFTDSAARKQRGAPVGLETGWAPLDDRAAIRSALVILLGHSGHGKSATALNLWKAVAGLGCTKFYSREMSGAEVANRMGAIISELPHKRIREWFVTPEEEAILAGLPPHLRKHRPHMFFDRSLRTTRDIRADCKRLKEEHGLKAIFIDYIQRLTGPGSSPEQVYSRISDELLDLAVDLDVAVIVTSQANEEAKKRKNTRLHFTDTKHCRSIGETGRVVISVACAWQEDPRDQELRQCVLDYSVAKNNEGPVGDFLGHFDVIRQRIVPGSDEVDRLLRTGKRDEAITRLCRENRCPKEQTAVNEGREQSLFD